jgi:hypothetical protein
MPTCLNCGLLNPPEAMVCDCGHRFAPEPIADRRSPADQRSTRPVSPQRGVSWLYQLCLVLILLWTAICFAGAYYGLMNIASEPTPTGSLRESGPQCWHGDWT